MHGAHHGFILLRPGHGEHSGEAGADGVGLVAHAAGDDHLAVFGNGLADRFQAFGLGGIQKPAGVDDHHVGAGIIARQRIAIGAQLGEDAFGIDQRLGATQGHHANAGSSIKVQCHRARRALFGQKVQVGSRRYRPPTGVSN